MTTTLGGITFPSSRYDSEADVLYLRLRDGEVTVTLPQLHGPASALADVVELS